MNGVGREYLCHCVQQVRRSISQVGGCIDNGPIEGFQGIPKCEMYCRNRFETYEDLVETIEKFIHYYKYGRRQRKLNCPAPIDYRIFPEAA